MDVAVGVDAHKASLAVAVVDLVGTILGIREFANDPKGHRALRRWVTRWCGSKVIGIEGSGSYGAGLCRLLIAEGEDVREVPANLTFVERKRRPSGGKSDPSDAVAIARIVLREAELPRAVKLLSAVELKALVDHRDQLIQARTQHINRIHKRLVTIHPGYQDRIPKLTTRKGLTGALNMMRGDHGVLAELVRFEVGEVRRLDRLVSETDDKVSALSGASLTSLSGCGELTAAKILGEVGDPRRLRSKAAFAMLNASAPVPASSGQTNRYRLNRGGNRQLNRALYTIAITRMRTDADTRAYVQRKRAEGNSNKDVMRCLKRCISDLIYRQLQSDLHRLI